MFPPVLRCCSAFARFERDSTFAPAVPALAAPAAGDLDGDGAVDVIVGGVPGGVVYFAGSRVGR
ncbi:MAG: hypothetical protein ACREMM_08900 [Gemmatimonadales bacterium]